MNSAYIYVRVVGLLLYLLLMVFAWRRLWTNAYLVGFYSCVTLVGVSSVVLFPGDYPVWMILFASVSFSLFFLVGPFALFFIKTAIHGPQKIRPIQYLHYLPFVLILAGFIPLFLSSWESKQALVENVINKGWQLNGYLFNKIATPRQIRILSVLHAMGYLIAIWAELSKTQRLRNSKLLQPDFHPVYWRWLQAFGILFTALVLVYLSNLLTVFFTIGQPDMPDYFERTQTIASHMFVLLMAVVLFFPMVVSGFVPTHLQDAAESERLGKPLQVLTDPAYIATIEEKLHAYIQAKTYTNPDSKLPDLAAVSGIPAHHLSGYFKTILQSSFPDWRNQLRINMAKELMLAGLHDELNMDGLAAKVGFTNRSTFSVVFRKLEGMSPSDFVKQQQEKG
jgi:AraC-like DNA-binding protein